MKKVDFAKALSKDELSTLHTLGMKVAIGGMLGEEQVEVFENERLVMQKTIDAIRAAGNVVPDDIQKILVSLGLK